MIWEEMERLAKAYLPQWNISKEAPDVGGVIALIYAEMMEKNLRYLEELPGRAHQEVLRLTGIRPESAASSKAILILEVDAAAREGVPFPKGSQFLTEVEGKETPVVFNSDYEVLAVYARLIDILQISEETRTVYGRTLPNRLFPVRMFDMEGDSLYREEIVLSHKEILKEEVRIPGNTFEGHSIRCVGARIRAYGMDIRPEVIYDGNQELEWESAAVFGRELTEYKECYIGHDCVFSKCGANIIMSFDMHFQVHSLLACEEEEWKLIKRKPKEKKAAPVPVYIQEAAFSYYNGIGWRKLKLEQEAAEMFSGEKLGREGRKEYQLRFRCPADWKPVIAGGRELRCIRIQVLRAANCYRQDAEHYYPVLEKIRLSYSYGASGTLPQRIFRRQGVSETEIVLREKFGDARPGAPVFLPFPYDGESVLLGFDRVFPTGNISLYLMLEEQQKSPGIEVSYEYSWKNGFKSLRTVDTTENLRRPGIVRFWMPEDAALLEIEGRKRFWIRMKASGMTAKGIAKRNKNIPVPCLKMVYLNGIEACNYEWSGMKEYYLDEPVPFLECPVAGERILETEVWVNETEVLSDEEMRRLLDSEWGREGNVRAERDYRGRISAFYVKWDEVESFELDKNPPRGYMLERRERKLRFGDGRKWRIPECTRGPAFCVRVKTCDGKQGNLREMQTYTPAVSKTFLKQVFQPACSVGGCDAETESLMEQRGNFRLNSRNRLVAENDYFSEMEMFSSKIARAKLIRGTDGRKKLVVLMRDFENGPAAFIQMKPALQEAVRKKQPFADIQKELVIEEPLFVRVSLEVWGDCDSRGVFEPQQRVLDKIRSFFRPEGFWQIGRIPGKAELETMLRTADERVFIHHFNAVFFCQDETGSHTWNLGKEVRLPEAVCVGGEHKVHLSGSKQEFGKA